MPWTKQKSGTKTVYTAPPEVYPMTKVVYDPAATPKWTVHYAWFHTAAETQTFIESLMGL